MKHLKKFIRKQLQLLSAEHLQRAIVAATSDYQKGLVEKDLILDEDDSMEIKDFFKVAIHASYTAFKSIVTLPQRMPGSLELEKKAAQLNNQMTRGQTKLFLKNLLENKQELNFSLRDGKNQYSAKYLVLARLFNLGTKPDALKFYSSAKENVLEDQNESKRVLRTTKRQLQFYEDKLNIAKNAPIIAKLRTQKNSFFARLPDELNVKIAASSAKALRRRKADQIARNNFKFEGESINSSRKGK